MGQLETDWSRLSSSNRTASALFYLCLALTVSGSGAVPCVFILESHLMKQSLPREAPHMALRKISPIAQVHLKPLFLLPKKITQQAQKKPVLSNAKASHQGRQRILLPWKWIAEGNDISAAA